MTGAGLCLLLAAGLLAGTARADTIVHSGVPRAFALHQPGRSDPGPRPLVIVLHGGGGSAGRMAALTRFDRLADTAGFLVAYPEAVNRHWNDGRNVRRFRAQREQVDDVGFISALIDRLVRDEQADPKRVYVTGISNGGMMCHRLGLELSGRVAAIAPVAAGLPEPLAEAWAGLRPQSGLSDDSVSPGRPVSVLAINGTLDPVVPYLGGGVGLGRKRGRVLSAPAAARFWARANGCSAGPAPELLPDREPSGGMRVRLERWTGGREGAEVRLYTVEGGGHTWPSGARRPRHFGRTSRDIDATELIWRFFKEHQR
jgi:polyhydroxybutyrate depolymerase